MTPGSEGVAASSQKPRIHNSIHGIFPSKEDDDDLVILGATKQGEGAVYDLLARDSVDSRVVAVTQFWKSLSGLKNM